MNLSKVWAGIITAGMAIGALGLGAQGLYAQDALPSPSPIEKTLAARASHTTEVTLDKTMLAFAAKFLDGKDEDGKEDKDQQAVKQMVQGLQGVYVRNYEFDKEHAYSAEELEGLRKYFENSNWSPMVRDRTKGVAQGTDVYVKLVDNKMQGLFVLDAEAKELSLVLILGPIDMDKLSQLGGNFGIPKDAMKKAQKAEAAK